MSSSDEEVEGGKRKKGIVNSEKYRRNIIKHAKVSGKAHINWIGKMVPAKSPGCCICRLVLFRFIVSFISFCLLIIMYNIFI